MPNVSLAYCVQLPQAAASVHDVSFTKMFVVKLTLQHAYSCICYFSQFFSL